MTPTRTPTVTPTAGPTATVTPPRPVDIYTTPGFHIANGRWWLTSCEPYSQTSRCTTEIWATQVVREGSRFVNKSGWYFNSLTYLPMNRATWAGNPLARTGEFTSSGRRWRTECDTPVTGMGGCRNYIRATTVQADKLDGRWTFRQQDTWVLNSMIRFN
ncbi:hypothetical protein [Tessaracoccus coleopterorum]|uniref:hypothetical protein n=1 Tax=Tessaracoccus coleopterorum TaxID=2714950 RepID=UPI0018D37F9F|nr:hypothetical protein [Tessaracoccus coleopterorum]